MNKAQLIEAVADRLGGSRRDANEAVEAVIDTITRTVAGGDRVAITGFGVFEKVDRPARTARNPRTGEKVKVKKTAVPRFRAGQGLKEVVSGSRKLPRLTATRPMGAGAKASSVKSTASTRPSGSKTTGTKATSGRSTRAAMTTRAMSATKASTSMSAGKSAASAKSAPARTTAAKSGKKANGKSATAKRSSAKK